jgi:hypothetical protein
MHSAEPADGAAGPRVRHPVDVVLFGLALALSAYVLFSPSPPGELPFPYADKAVHASVFLVLAWTGSRVGLPLPGLAIGLVVYAVGSEVIQYALLAERSGDWTDAAADLVGAMAGLALGRRGDRDTRSGAR